MLLMERNLLVVKLELQIDIDKVADQYTEKVEHLKREKARKKYNLLRLGKFSNSPNKREGTDIRCLCYFSIGDVLPGHC